MGGTDLEDPAETKAGVHELHELQQELQCVHIPIKAISQVDVLHLRRAGTLKTRLTPSPGAIQGAAA